MVKFSFFFPGVFFFEKKTKPFCHERESRCHLLGMNLRTDKLQKVFDYTAQSTSENGLRCERLRSQG